MERRETYERRGLAQGYGEAEYCGLDGLEDASLYAATAFFARDDRGNQASTGRLMVNRISLNPHMECPSCHRRYREGYGALFFPACQSRTCRTRWWSCQVFEGDLLDQLTLTFGDEGARAVFSALESPPKIVKGPMFLSIVITGHQFHRYTTDRTTVREMVRSILPAA